MMLSKTTWYAFIVALCLVISESDGVEEIKITECHDDDAFLAAAEQYARKIVPILVIKTEYSKIVDYVKKCFRDTYTETLIVVYVDNDKCPETDKFLNTENIYPLLYVIKRDRLYHNKINPNTSTEQQLLDFYGSAYNWQIPQDNPYVAYSMQIRINERNSRLAMQAVNATAALNSAVTQSYSVAIDSYSRKGQPGYLAGSFMGYSAGDSSRKRPKSHSPSPPTFLDKPQTLNLFRTSPPRAESSMAKDDPWLGVGTIIYDPKEKRKASPPLNDRSQKRRMSNQERREMGLFLASKFEKPPPLPPR